MKCPNCDIELTSDVQKVEFEDLDDNCITIKVTAEWCAECNYVHWVYLS